MKIQFLSLKFYTWIRFIFIGLAAYFNMKVIYEISTGSTANQNELVISIFSLGFSFLFSVLHTMHSKKIIHKNLAVFLKKQGLEGYEIETLNEKFAILKSDDEKIIIEFSINSKFVSFVVYPFESEVEVYFIDSNQEFKVSQSKIETSQRLLPFSRLYPHANIVKEIAEENQETKKPTPS